MKHSAVRTLGVAALGAAFAAAGAGAANAAVPAVPDAAPALGTVARTLPAGDTGMNQPAATDALSRGQDALGAGMAATQPAVENALHGGPTGPLHSRIGGLPVQGAPVHGLPVNGLSLG
ncbi:ATP-binding protein [Streptomyces incarnatus]|uniref:ATP-binding protein n=1 Tax=Streptomyces incarnatus TaxID=665007 RepID=A0ABM5TJK0_9ACTN|nr:ATP-binding protein [Streptomyces incarnatus]AKJ11177.1 ATP-binding protein [Streptomyces incarnatus]